ncbi:MAG: PhzF family phenazine biosynthesis protein [candidate division Zixibacteria bacterium]|nr:PhzF family phenazine biosynthesis protein [candidate division Zixibacteria bacterium]
MPQSIIQVDSFASEPFKGNPAGVCLLKRAADESWMQNVASEMNLSETAFLYPEGEGYHLRWFTPKCEVEMCGHGTLASAHLLFEDGHLPPDATALFYTLSGELRACKVGALIELDFPATPAEEVEPPFGLLEALGTEARFVGMTRFDALVDVGSEKIVRGMQPDFGSLAAIDVRGAVVTAPSDSAEYDFVSRFFAPAAGINEDPVTGSAHCALGPYWQTRLGKNELTAFQASARGGEVHVRINGDRVFLAGRAVTVIRGELV